MMGDLMAIAIIGSTILRLLAIFGGLTVAMLIVVVVLHLLRPQQ